MSELDLEPKIGKISTLLVDAEVDSLADRLSILQIINLYSHLVDDFDPNHWAELFTEEARFEIRFGRGGSEDVTALDGRRAILDVIMPRQMAFREACIQRRHYLTNPVVVELESKSARVMAYLMLASIHPERGMEIEGTGRYDGVVVRTAAGWRIQSWRLTADGRGEKLTNVVDPD